MLLVDGTLLCIAALLSHGVVHVHAVPHWGRFDRRSNQTTSTTVASTGASSHVVQSGSASLSSADEATGGFVAGDVVTARLSVASAGEGYSTTTSSLPSSTQPLVTLHGLESITTKARPTTFTLGVSASNPIADESSTLPASGSASSEVPTTDSASALPTTTEGFYLNTSSIGGSSPPGYPLSNSTRADLGWNSTSTANLNLTTSTVDAPLPPIVTYDPQTLTVITPDAPTANTCDVTTNSDTVTVWSTIYTTTITWTLPPELYTPPYPPNTTIPIYCAASPTTARLSASMCEGSGCTVYTYPGATSTTEDGHRHVNPTATAGTTVIYASSGKMATPTITFWTTDKNPAVVYSSEAPPDYGDSGTTLVQDHNTPDSNNSPTSSPEYDKHTTISTPTGNGDNSDGGSGNDGGGGNGGAATTSPEAARQSPATTAVTVIIQTTNVIINDHTFTDSPQSATSTVVVGTDTFIINPSEVIGAGATVIRPVGGVFIPTKTTTTVAGVEVVYTAIDSSAATGKSVLAVATIDGTTFTIGTAPSTAVVKGQTITLGPNGISFATQTLPIVTAAGGGATESAVLGGEMITAIGKSIVVIEGTTITYGPGMSIITEVIDRDTILIGPSGVSVHGITLGGITAAPTATTYEIVGGATITQIGGSAVVIDGTTYSIGAAATTAITTVIDGQTLTIGPSGVAASSYTFAQPYVTSTVIEPGSTSSVAAATTTAENAGPILRPAWNTGILGMCIAIGVGFLGGLLL